MAIQLHVICTLLSMAAAVASTTLKSRASAALWGLLVGDALAAPAHWIYNTDLFATQFPPDGRVTGYVKPPERLPGSIMSVSSTSGGGRGGDTPLPDGRSLVGDIIMHGKRKYWARGGNYNYHCSLAAGEVTVEASVTRLVMRHIASAAGTIEPSRLLDDYVSFMTTPGSHNDAYIGTAHRMFFRNLVVGGKRPSECADDDGHNVAAIDALTWISPTILASLVRADAAAGRDSAVADAARTAMRQLLLNRRVPEMEPFVEAYCALTYDALIAQVPVREAAMAAAASIGFDLAGYVRQQSRSGSEPMTACYIDSSFKVLLYFIARYGESSDIGATLLRSVNAGGENVARGASLGFILGAAHGLDALGDWPRGLHDSASIASEIDDCLGACGL